MVLCCSMAPPTQKKFVEIYVSLAKKQGVTKSDMAS